MRQSLPNYMNGRTQFPFKYIFSRTKISRKELKAGMLLEEWPCKG